MKDLFWNVEGQGIKACLHVLPNSLEIMPWTLLVLWNIKMIISRIF